MSQVQHRIMHTYEVTVGDTGLPETVNLSYELNDELEPINNSGEVVTPMSVDARIEVSKRLRKLAAKGRTAATVEQVEQSPALPRLVRTSFVEVRLDESGRPIPRQS